jgi:hypothetical protein
MNFKKSIYLCISMPLEFILEIYLEHMELLLFIDLTYFLSVHNLTLHPSRVFTYNQILS